jgi:hypothetical protein
LAWNNRFPPLSSMTQYQNHINSCICTAKRNHSFVVRVRVRVRKDIATKVCIRSTTLSNLSRV